MDSTQRFFTLLNQFPKIARLWDATKHEMRVEEFEIALRTYSSGEVELARFFAAIWFNTNERYGFDLVQALHVLDAKGRRLITDWMAMPFWP